MPIPPLPSTPANFAAADHAQARGAPAWKNRVDETLPEQSRLTARAALVGVWIGRRALRIHPG